MARLLWTRGALRDVERLRGFLASKNPAAAHRATQAIRQGARTLVTHPEIGRPADEMPPDFREWIIPFGGSGYVMLYRFDGDLVAVLAVRHGRGAGHLP